MISLADTPLFRLNGLPYTVVHLSSQVTTYTYKKSKHTHFPITVSHLPLHKYHSVNKPQQTLLLYQQSLVLIARHETAGINCVTYTQLTSQLIIIKFQ